MTLGKRDDAGVDGGRTGLIRRLALGLTTGVVFTFFSEWAFWGRPLHGALPADVFPTVLAYAFAAYAFLVIVSFFRVRSLEALFLAGALYGWLVEGVLVQTLYDDFPFNLSWTGLAWHVLITVLFGWYALPGALRRGRAGRVAALAGLVYGLWAVGWWSEALPPTPWAWFASYVTITTAGLAIAYWTGSRLHLTAFKPGRLEGVALCAMIATYFALVTVPAQPLSALVLPPLAGGVVLTLRRNAQREHGDDWVTQDGKDGPIPVRRLLALTWMPLTALSVYALLLRLNWSPPTGMLLYAVTTPLGFVLLVHSAAHIWRRPLPPGAGCDAPADRSGLATPRGLH